MGFHRLEKTISSDSGTTILEKNITVVESVSCTTRLTRIYTDVALQNTKGTAQYQYLTVL